MLLSKICQMVVKATMYCDKGLKKESNLKTSVVVVFQATCTEDEFCLPTTPVEADKVSFYLPQGT